MPPPTPKVHLQAKPALAAPRSVHQPPGRTRTIQRAQELEEVPNLPVNDLRKKALKLQASAKSVRELVDGIFDEFLRMGFGYDLGTSQSVAVLGIGAKPLKPHERFRDCFGGNCIALAGAFASVLSEVEVEAEAREVRSKRQGKAFIVYAPHFIDQQVTGNIYKEGVLWPNRYLFDNHAATWVKELNRFYDPMAGETYQATPDVVMELEDVGSDNEFTGNFQGSTWHLVRRNNLKALPGNFFRFDMSKVEQGYMVTPLGTFKQSK